MRGDHYCELVRATTALFTHLGFHRANKRGSKMMIVGEAFKMMIMGEAFKMMIMGEAFGHFMLGEFNPPSSKEFPFTELGRAR